MPPESTFPTTPGSVILATAAARSTPEPYFRLATFADETPTWVHVDGGRYSQSELTPAALVRDTSEDGASPVVTDEHGRIVVRWPYGRGIARVHPEVIEGWAEGTNQLRTALEEARASAPPTAEAPSEQQPPAVSDGPRTA